MSKDYQPSCCGLEASWINNGTNLQYWYCRECKQEVSPFPPLEAVSTPAMEAAVGAFNKAMGAMHPSQLALKPVNLIKRMSATVPPLQRRLTLEAGRYRLSFVHGEIEATEMDVEELKRNSCLWVELKSRSVLTGTSWDDLVITQLQEIPCGP
jgi:hypothetical protein